MLDIRDLHVSVGGRPILAGIDLHVGEGETVVLLGPNGVGKTTLLHTVMGFPGCRVTRGRILFRRRNVTHLPVDERARLGMGLAMQRPPSVRGVRLRVLLEACLVRSGSPAPERLQALAAAAAVSHLLERDVNRGFSGGEIKRSELAQVMAQDPELALFDEPDSGVDLESMVLVGGMVNGILRPEGKAPRSGLIITHSGHILSLVRAHRACVMSEGALREAGDPLSAIEAIKQHGYGSAAP